MGGEVKTAKEEAMEIIDRGKESEEKTDLEGEVIDRGKEGEEKMDLEGKMREGEVKTAKEEAMEIQYNTIQYTMKPSTICNIREIIDDTMKQENIGKIRDMIDDIMKQHKMNICDTTKEEKTDEKIDNNK